MVVKNPKFVISAVCPAQYPDSELLEIAFAGRSNVGKSSLINALVGRKRLAYSGSTQGMTRQINFYNLDDEIHFVDLPGYGYAKRSKESKQVWSSLTESFFTSNPSSDALKLVIQLIDVRTGPTDDDVMMINWMIDMGVPFTVVATKTDKLSKNQLNEALKKINDEYFLGTGIEILPFSSVTRAGKDELWRKIFDAIS